VTFWDAATQAAGEPFTETIFAEALAALERQRENFVYRGCPHLVSGRRLREWRDDGRDVVACPTCGATVRVPPAGPPVSDVAVPPRHDEP
jgi:hypothetical protein